MAEEKKRGKSRLLLWIILASVVVVAGAVVAVVLFGPADTPFIGEQVAGLRSLVGSPIPQFGEVEPGVPIPPGQRVHEVQEGETLWSIAKQSGLVSSPWEWRTILAQNRDKFDYALVTVATGEWKVLMESGQVLAVSDEPPPAPAGPVIKKYAVQLLTVSADQRQRAHDIVQRLLGEDVYAFMYLSEENGGPAYRVRAGFYETEDEAQAAADPIGARHAAAGTFPDEPWVTVSSDRELRGELFDFGAQRTSPWVIELPRRATHADAMADLRRAGDIGGFAHIAQKPGRSTSRFIYSLRIGFFTTYSAAQALLEENREGLPVLRDAQVIALKRFAELLPGQRFKNLGGGS